MSSPICQLLVNHAHFDPQIHSLMKSFGPMRKNFNNVSPHANRLVRPPRFLELFEDEAGSDALEDDRCQRKLDARHTP